jgi:hypothetical protein
MDTRNPTTSILSIMFGVVSLCCADVVYGETAVCALLTQNQVSTIVGVKVGAGSPIANTGCSWTAAGPPRITVSVSVQSEKMFAAAKSSAPPKTTKTSISGPGGRGNLHRRREFLELVGEKRNQFPLIRIYGLSVSDAQTKLKALATNALSKL